MVRLTLALITLATALAVPGSGGAAVPGFVQAEGERLVVDGVPWRAIGVNHWDMHASKVLAGDLTGCWYQHADLDAYLDQSFARIKANTAATAVRTFGFRMMYTDGGRDWSSTDKLVYYARKHDLRLIPVFGDQYGTCGSPAKDTWWYRTGYRTLVEQPWGADYRSYVVQAVRRYRDEPAIAFWQLMNEATAGQDTDALLSFSRDMASAIRNEAGDARHLINLGTAGGSVPGNELPGYADLLACGATGGCNDLAESHVFNAEAPLPGLPLPSAIDATLSARNAAGTANGVTVRPVIDGWTRVTVTPPPSVDPWTSWWLSLSTPAGGDWSAYVDDVVIHTGSGPVLATFEAGTEGYASPDATVSRSTLAARNGLASLRLAVPGSAGARVVRLDAPPAADIASVELWIRLNFRAARPSTGASIAANLHAATVARAMPFVLGEAGWQAAVPGLSRCASHRSTAQRANLLDEMARTQLDPVYGSDGLLIWDWKDPSIQASAPDGTPIGDPAVDCWTVVPGDPAEAVLKTYAEQVPQIPRLPAPAALPHFDHRLTVLAPPPASVGHGMTVPVTMRLTRGGNAVAGVTIVAGGGCAGSAKTDALGLVQLTCEVVAPAGETEFSIAPLAQSCGCSIEPLRFPVLVKRALALSAAADVAETGQAMKLRLGLRALDGGTVEGVRWRVPECGAEGEVTEAAESVEILATCPGWVDWRGSTLLRLVVDGDAETLPASLGFVGLRFDRVFFDARARECIGLAPGAGHVGATTRPGACGSRSGGSYADWFLFDVPPGERDAAFRQVGSVMTVNVDAREGRRIDGVFSWNAGNRTFAATVMRSDGIHPLSST